MADETKPKKRSLIRESLAIPEIKDIDIPEIEYNEPAELTPEQKTERENARARRALSTTGPIVLGKKGNIATPAPVGGGEPNFQQPNISSDPTQQQIVGAQRVSRMIQPQSQGEQVTSPNVEAFAQGKQNYQPQVGQPVNQSDVTTEGMQPAGADHNAGVYAGQHNIFGGAANEQQEQMNLNPVGGVQMQAPEVNPNLRQPNLQVEQAPEAGNGTGEKTDIKFDDSYKPSPLNKEGRLDVDKLMPKENIALEPSVWDNGFKDAIEKNNIPLNQLGQAVNNYNEWAKKNGKDPVDFPTVMAMYQNYDPDKSVADNKKSEKRAENKEKWERIGNFLNHLGNFIGTVKGGVDQKPENAVELSKRQRELKDKTLAQRRQNWQDIMTAYKQSQADKLAARNADTAAKREARLEAETKSRVAKNDAYNSYIKAKEAGETEKAAYYKAMTEALEAGKDLDTALKEAKIAAEKARANAANASASANNALAEQRRSSAGGSTTEYERDKKGRVTKSTKTPNNSSKTGNNNSDTKEIKGVTWKQ